MLGETLLKLRKKFGYSQQELADKLSVTRQTISNWECGQGAPTLEKAAELAAIFQMSLDDLVGNQVEVVIGERQRPSNRLLRQLEGKTIKLSCFDLELWMEEGFDCGFTNKAKVLEVTDEWLRIEYARTKENHLVKKETVVKLFDINLIKGIEILEEEA